MATVHLTQGAFDKVVARSGIVLVDFWATWCGPCRAFAPVYEQASERHAGVLFGKVDTDAEQRLASGWGIQSIPTVMAFKDGVPVFSQPGVLPAAVLDELVGKLRALDMAAVRRELSSRAPPLRR
jgi:thioredoxin 1